jgi:hypothetical protein
MCYRFELLEFEDCLFKNIDATYILHLEGNGRIDSIHEQLKTYHPTKKVYIVYNKGYKNCYKDLEIQSSGHDIVHANITVFEHAEQYKHILVLEDDFIFSKEIPNHSTHVDTFLEKDTSFVYQLGSVPFFAIPINMHHYRILAGTAHANIYSKSARNHITTDYKNHKITGKIGGLDNYIVKYLPMYMYHKPLCYQTFPMTDNRKEWFKGDGFMNYITPIIDFMLTTCISWTNLEREPEPGFSIIYWIAKCMPLLLILFLVVISKVMKKKFK